MPLSPRTTNPGPELESVELDRNSRGGQRITTKNKVPTDTAISSSLAYGTTEAKLLQEQTNEKVSSVTVEEHPEITGQFFNQEVGQLCSLKRKRVAAGTSLTLSATLLEGRIDPEDTGHSDRYVVELIGSARVRSFVEWDDEVKVDIYTTRQLVAKATASPAIGDGVAATSRFYIDVQRFDFNSELDLLLTRSCVVPSGRVVFESVGFQFPAVVTIPSSSWSTTTDFTIKPPWVGTHYNIIPHRTASRAAAVYYTYSHGVFGTDIPQTFAVSSPGAASRILPIPPNSIHPAFTYHEVTPSTEADVEVFSASTPSPSVYDADKFLVADARERIWKGLFRERRVVFLSLNTQPEDFPASYTLNSGVVVPA